MPTAVLEEHQPERHGVYVALMGKLGQRTAEMHRAFAVVTEDPAFRPRPVTAADLKRWKAGARNQAQRAVRVLARAAKDLSERHRAMAEAMVADRRSVLARIDGLLPDRVDAKKTRYHGDYHLGQVVLVHDDFFILDFEGEPARTLQQRRNKASPLRDVAGMLRSFDYAARTALGKLMPEEAERREVLARHVADWNERSRQAFLGGYLAAIDGCPSHPEDPDTFERLLQLFEIEKVCYEICYERANRPDWLWIPLEGLQAALERGP
jgi:maltose alpha-D-glucosyltransferase/alpha-amylase